MEMMDAPDDTDEDEKEEEKGETKALSDGVLGVPGSERFAGLRGWDTTNGGGNAMGGAASTGVPMPLDTVLPCCWDSDRTSRLFLTLLVADCAPELATAEGVPLELVGDGSGGGGASGKAVPTMPTGVESGGGGTRRATGAATTAAGADVLVEEAD